jgi:quinoprotein relay system zinc metallohydrolase 2
LSGAQADGRSRRDLLLAGFGGLCLCCLPTRGGSAAATTREIAPGLFVRRGVDEDATRQNLDAIANIGFIVGGESVLVTDSGGSLEDGQWLRRQIKATTNKPIRYVVLSHVHPDHTFGAGAFVEDRPVFLGHAKLPEALNARGAFYRQGLGDILGADKVGPVVLPTKTIADTMEIDLGGRTIAFKAHGTAHTPTDLSMLDKTTGILLPADLLFVGRVPSIDGSVVGWLKELDVLAAMGAAKAVPGHGPDLVAFRPATDALRTYLTALRDGVRGVIKKSGSIDDAIRTVAQAEKPHWLLFDDYNGRNVTEVYKELEWE